MKEKLAKYPRLRLALTVAIPVLAMVVTIAMIGASFAWFSDSSDVYIESVTISTKEAYTITFGLGDDLTSDNLKYKGQMAIGGDGKIVTSSNRPDDDRPYCFTKVVSLDTLNREFDINIQLDTALIREVLDTEPVSYRELNSYGLSSAGSNDASLIPYVFTWFFKEHTGGVESRALNYFIDGEESKMMYYEPRNESWYTPYGLLTFDDTGTISHINGEVVDINTITTMEKRDIVHFTTGKSATLYDFYIVFAPEDLFYRQFFTGVTANTLATVYDATAQAHILGSGTNQMYYSTYRYLGSEFVFSALINITQLYGEA